MKKTLPILLILLAFCLLAGCTDKEAAEASAPVPSAQIVNVTVTPAPTSRLAAALRDAVAQAELSPSPVAETPEPEPSPQETALPVIDDPSQVSFPGGLDDDGRGPDEDDDGLGSGLSFLTPVEFIELDAEKQYEANIFLSNFAEQGINIYFYDLSTSRVLPSLVDFAHNWYKINDYGAISYGELDDTVYEILSAEQILAVIHRYISLPLTTEAFEYYYYPQEHSFYQDGSFFFDPADGEAYNRIAVADSLSLLDDGRYCLTFTEYEIDLDAYFSFDDGIPRSYYELDPFNASQHQMLTRIADGYAIVEPYQYSGRSTYQLYEYTSW